MSEGWVPSGAQKRLVACVRDLSGPDRVGGRGEGAAVGVHLDFFRVHFAEF